MTKSLEALVAEIKSAAEKATSGTWEMDGENIWYSEGGYTKHLMYACQGDDVDEHQDDLNTRYIAAANPENVLALIAALCVKLPNGWISVSDSKPDPNDSRRVCVFTPSEHEDLRYRFVPASLFKAVCSEATHWHYMTMPSGTVESE